MKTHFEWSTFFRTRHPSVFLTIHNYNYCVLNCITDFSPWLVWLSRTSVRDTNHNHNYLIIKNYPTSDIFYPLIRFVLSLRDVSIVFNEDYTFSAFNSVFIALIASIIARVLIFKHPLSINSMFQFFKITHFRLKFPKGMYVYRNITDWFSQIPKGFYVIVDILHIIPSGFRKKCLI